MFNKLKEIYATIEEWLHTIVFVTVMLVFTTFVVFVVYISVNAEPSEKLTLVKEDFACVKTHKVTRLVPIGKITMPRQEEVCDAYERKK